MKRNPILERHRLRHVDPTAVTNVLRRAADRGQQLIPLEQIAPRPGQPRRYFDRRALEELARSIRSKGLLQPIVVRPKGEDRFEIVAGERRYRAFKLLGRRQIPAIVVELDDVDAQAAAVLENLQREDLNPVEETEAILSLLEMRLGQPRDEIIRLFHRVARQRQRRNRAWTEAEAWDLVEKTFRELGRMTPESFRTNRLPLLRLPADVLEALRRGELDYTKARAIARVKDGEMRRRLLEKVVEEGWSLALVRAEVREILNPESQRPLLARRAKRVLNRLADATLTQEKEERALELIEELEALLGGSS